MFIESRYYIRDFDARIKADVESIAPVHTKDLHSNPKKTSIFRHSDDTQQPQVAIGSTLKILLNIYLNRIKSMHKCFWYPQAPTNT